MISCLVFRSPNWDSEKGSILPEATQVVRGASELQSMLLKPSSLRLLHCVTQCQNAFGVPQWVRQRHATCRERAGERAGRACCLVGAAYPCWVCSTSLQRSLPPSKWEYTCWLCLTLGSDSVTRLRGAGPFRWIDYLRNTALLVHMPKFGWHSSRRSWQFLPLIWS